MATTVYSRAGKQTAEWQFQALVQNAYRVLGLPGAASQRDIYEAAAALRLALKLGVEKTFPGDLPWLGPVNRTETDVRDALSRLADPSRRIFERLFWFYEGMDVPASLSKNESGELLAATQKLAFAGKASVRHGAALLLIASLPHFDSEMKNEGEWVRALTFWRESVEGDEFWSLLIAADLKGDFEPLATYTEIRNLRGRALRLMTTPIAERAKDALAREDFRACRRALAVLREAALPAQLWAEYENDILAPIEEEVESTCRSVFAWARFVAQGTQSPASRKETYGKALADYNSKLAPQLKKMLVLAGAASPAARRALESAASGLNDLATYYKDIGEAGDAANLYRRAWTLAPPGSETLLLIEENLRPGAGGDSTRLKTDDEHGDARAQAKTEDEYAVGVERELRDTPTRPPLFKQYLGTEKVASESGCMTSLMWVGVGLMIFVLLSKCGGGSSSGSRYRPYPNYNLAIPRFTPPPLPAFDPKTFDPKTFEPLRPIVPPTAPLKNSPRRARERRRTSANEQR